MTTLESRRDDAGSSGRAVSLTLAELVCIENTLSPSQVVQEVGPDKTMVLRIGGALVEAQKTTQDQLVWLSDADLWLLRERLSVYAAQGVSVSLGLVLKCKIYEAPLSINAEAAVKSLGLEVLSDDHTYESTDADASADESAGDGAGAETET